MDSFDGVNYPIPPVHLFGGPWCNSGAFRGTTDVGIFCFIVDNEDSCYFGPCSATKAYMVSPRLLIDSQ